MNKNIQLTHAEHRPSGKKFALSVLASDLHSGLNVGSLFRLCDAMAVQTLYLCGDTPAPPDKNINKTARASDKYVHYECHDDAQQLLSALKTAGILVVALEITSSSIALNSAQFHRAVDGSRPVCLVLGAEDSGVSEALLALAEITVHIPMYGYNSSMNVATAAGIACFEIISNLL